VHRRALGILVAASLYSALVGCVTPRVPYCPPGFIERPPITKECRLQAGSQLYMRDIVDRFASKFDGLRSYPGQLDLSIAYAADASIESVCLRQKSGEQVERRGPRAVRALRNVGSAPACFADRRIEIEWSSALITHTELRAALRHCGAWSTPTQALRACTNSCSMEERALLSRNDERVLTCLSTVLPLAIGWRGSDELVSFLPRADVVPSSDRAFYATRVCSGMAERAAVVSCMRHMGWEEVDWETHRRSLLD
jgi:hypothetical protein